MDGGWKALAHPGFLPSAGMGRDGLRAYSRQLERPQDEERMRSMEQCAFCHGELEEKTILYTSEFEGRVVVVENVPALVCRQCGETVLRPEVVEKLQKIIWGQLPETGRRRGAFCKFG